MITKTYYRLELFNTLKNQLGYLTSQFPDGSQALEEAEGHLAEYLNCQLRRAYIAGHAEGAISVIQDNKLPLDFSPETDAIYAARKYEDWKNGQ